MTISHPGRRLAIRDDTLYFGAAYYPEYFPTRPIDLDLDLMADAGVTVIRVGESVWSTWEPRDGEFALDWLRPVLDGARQRGIAVIIGTPTYAIPPWMQKAHPEFAAESATGRPVPWGSRQEVDFTNPEFRRYAERLIRAVIGEYAAHPAVIGVQVDNEPGLHLLHNPAVFARFVSELAAEFGDVEALNEAWGLVYWSHRLDSFDELWTPDGNSLPQYDLAWRRFQARLTEEFIGWQADLVRELAPPDRFVTTCLAYSRPTVDDVALVKHLDMAAANLYYGMQDHLDPSQDLARIAPWTSTGVWGLLLAADRAYATALARFLVTETNAQAIGASDQNLPPYPGQLTQAALALVARGASMVEYWHWNTIPYGTETFWGGVLPHSGRPGRVYAEATRIGAMLRELGPLMVGYRPDHDVTMLYSNSSRWAMDFFPPLAGAPAKEQGGAYGVAFGAAYRGFVDAGRQVAILNDTMLDRYEIDELVRDHPVLVVVGLYSSTDAITEKLLAYARAGGHLVLGIRSLVADEAARIRTEIAPPAAHTDAGAWYEESSNIATAVRVESETVPLRGSATLWIDGLVAEDAEVVARYVHPRFGDFAAVTTRATGDGRLTMIGCVADRELAESFARWITPAPIARRWGRLPRSVTVHSGVTSAGARVWFLHNWGASAVTVTVPPGLRPLGGDATATHDIALDAWGVQVWIGDDDDS